MVSCIRTNLLPTGLALVTAFMIAAAPAHAVNRDVDLVLLVVVDMLKGEMPFSHYDRLGDKGLKRLMEGGVSYTNAHYQHSTTFTAVGHGVIATGAPAAKHGLAGNDWQTASPASAFTALPTPTASHWWRQVFAAPPHATSLPQPSPMR